MWPETVQEWLTLASTFIAVSAMIGAPLVRMLCRYRNTLNEAVELIHAQRETNNEQDQRIKESSECYEKMKLVLDHVKELNLTQTKIEIDKICDRAITHGCVTPKDLEAIKTLFPPYEKCGGNHNTKAKVEVALKLPCCPLSKQKMEA